MTRLRALPTRKVRLPRTHAELQRLLSNATSAGYLAGMRDQRHGEDVPRRTATQRRRLIRAELEWWMTR